MHRLPGMKSEKELTKVLKRKVTRASTQAKATPKPTAAPPSGLVKPIDADSDSSSSSSTSSTGSGTGSDTDSSTSTSSGSGASQCNAIYADKGHTAPLAVKEWLGWRCSRRYPKHNPEVPNRQNTYERLVRKGRGFQDIDTSQATRHMAPMQVREDHHIQLTEQRTRRHKEQRAASRV